MGPGRSYFGTAAIEGGVSEKLETTMGFFSFFDQGIVSQTPFQIEDTQKSVFFSNRRYSRSVEKHVSNRR